MSVSTGLSPFLHPGVPELGLISDWGATATYGSHCWIRTEQLLTVDSLEGRLQAIIGVSGGKAVGDEYMLPMRDAIEPRRVYTLEEGREVLELSDTTFRLLVYRGEIKGRKAGRRWRFLGSELLEFLEHEGKPSSREPQ